MSPLSKPRISMFCLILGSASVVAGCGTGFVKGWRKSGDAAAAAHEPRCMDGYTPVGNDCKKIGEDTASAAQCTEKPGVVWANGKCVDLPTLAVDGVSEQTLASGLKMAPLPVKASAGAAVELRDQSCPGYFSFAGGTIASQDGLSVPAGTSSCTANVVAARQGVASNPVAITIHFSRGFFLACNDPKATAAERTLVLAIKKVFQQANCASANNELTKATTLVLSGNKISDIALLTGLTNLTWLDIGGNNVADLRPIASLSKLAWLDVSSNPITELSSLKGLKNLSNLIATGVVLPAKTEANCPTVDVVAPLKEFCAP